MVYDSKKIKAMERLIFLARVNKKENRNDGFKESAKELDDLKIPMWKQNNIAYLSTETDMYKEDIIKEVYYAKKPVDVQKIIKKYKTTL